MLYVYEDFFYETTIAVPSCFLIVTHFLRAEREGNHTSQTGAMILLTHV